MLGNYFRELLEKHNRVIIPDFGAFLVKDTGDVRSLTNTSFSPFLRYNDGLIEAFLAEKEGLTKAEATTKVKEYVDSLKLQLEKGTQVELPQLGYFYQDARGNIQFQLDLTSTALILKEEKRNTSSVAAEKPEQASPLDEKEETASAQIADASAVVTPPVEPRAIVQQESPAKEPQSPPKPVPPVKRGKLAHRPKPKEEVKAAKSEPTQKIMAQSTNKRTTKSSKKYWLLIAGLITVLLIVIWQYDSIVRLSDSIGSKETIINTNASTDSVAPLQEKSIVDTVVVASESHTPTYVKPKIDIPENIFLVVVGSFTQKQNAENQLQKLEEQGYQPTIILRKNGTYSVVISGHRTKDEAKLSLQSYKKKNGEAWIMAR